MRDALLLDAPSLFYRAFFALPKTIVDPRGNSVNAIRGFLDMTAWLIGEHRAATTIAVFDADWRPAERVAAYAHYKAERPNDPPEMEGQLEVLIQVPDAAGVARVEAPGLEADDAIATLVARKRPQELFAIVSGDRDLTCLVHDPDVVLFFPTRGVRNLEPLDEKAVIARYGVPPALYADFATLRGDPSDGLPGISGIGPVGAAQLLRRHGSLEELLQHVDDLPPRQRAAFRDAGDYLEAMTTVVTLRSDAQLEVTQAGEIDEQAIERLAEEHNLRSSATRLVRALRKKE
jgi:5'-3' exonuclease